MQVKISQEDREEARKRRPLPSATLYDFAEQEGSA